MSKRSALSSGYPYQSGVPTTYPLAPAQALIWSGARIHPDAPFANMTTLSRLNVDVNVERFFAAFDAVVAAHESLRTVFEESSSAPLARVLDVAPRRVEHVVLDNEDTLQGWMRTRLAQPLDYTECCYDGVLLSVAGRTLWWLALHHLITDATSSALIFAHLSAAYAGEQVPSSSYAVYLRELNERQNHKAWKRAQSHWEQFSSIAQTPSLYHSARAATTHSTRVAISLTPARRAGIARLLSDEFKTLSPQLGWSAMLATVTAVFRHRLSDCGSTVFAVPVHNRDRSNKHVVGLCIELFPMTVEVKVGETFHAVYNRALQALLVLASHARPGTSPNVAVDAVLNVTRVPFGTFDGQPTQTDYLDNGSVEPIHALRVQSHAWNGDDQFDLALDVNHGVVDAHAIESVPEHYVAVLDQIIAAPDSSIGEFSLQCDTERSAMARYNTREHTATTATVLTMLDEALAGSTDVSLREQERAFTATDFVASCERVASWLVARGVMPGDKVGIRMAPCADAVIAIHGVLRAGGVFVPLDASYPQARLDYMQRDAGVCFVIDALPGDLQEAAQPMTRIDVGVKPSDLAYIIYTSGSTGQPKGVPITHRGLAEYLSFAVQAYMDSEQRLQMALYTSLSFDLTITSLFLPFLTNGTLHCHPAGGAAALREIVDEQKVNTLKATPSHLQLLARLPKKALCLRTLIVGGEQFTVALAQRLKRTLRADVRLYNEYGPTEAVVGCMVHEYDPNQDGETQVPIGRPAPGVVLEVLDQYKKPVPMGSPGELYISRPGMTVGYLHRPELNDERFVVLDAHAPVQFYRSGDLVRMRDPQSMVYLGRTDEQVKVQGVRLDPQEVETALLHFPGVKQCVVRLWRDSDYHANVDYCERCGIPSNVPDVQIDEEGICSTCRTYRAIIDQTKAYFKSRDELKDELRQARETRGGSFDVLHLLSGGKDSTYALYELVALGADVCSITLDNGFISDAAKDNARRVAAHLGIEHEFVSTPAMNAIFRDSLERHSNVCNGCYKAIYTLAINKANALGIPFISTGLSRGQLFETRLTPGQFDLQRFDVEAIDAAVVAARKAYHRTPDAVSKLLDVSVFDDDTIFQRVRFLDVYRYVDVELRNMMSFLHQSTPWRRPPDTGRSTNCLINAAGIAVHQLERGYHNYAMPYSWDVRLGHKTRQQAMEELDDPIDPEEVARMLAEIGYQPQVEERLTAWYVAKSAVDDDMLKRHLAQRLPAYAVPRSFIAVDSIALNPNGKVDLDRLPAPQQQRVSNGASFIAPQTLVEEALCEMWQTLLEVERVGVEDDFFALGGTSLRALEMVMWASEHFEVTIPEASAFENRTVRQLGSEIEDLLIASVEAMSEDDVRNELGRRT